MFIYIVPTHPDVQSAAVNNGVFEMHRVHPPWGGGLVGESATLTVCRCKTPIVKWMHTNKTTWYC